VGKGIVALPTDSQTVVLAALIGAICWNLLTWYLGLPSSSSHALIGGLVGATLVAVGTSGVEWSGIWHKVVLPMVSSPLAGLLVAFLLMNLLLLLVFRYPPRPVNRTFRALQPISAGAVALAHGMNDAQKTMGVIWLALITSGHLSKNAPIPTWVILVAASSIALGTYFGGWRIIRTLGTKIIHLDPIHGFAAETSSAAVIWTGQRPRLPDLHDTDDHRLDHGLRRHRRALGGQVGRGRQHRLGLATHDPRRRSGGRRRLLSHPPDPLSADGRAVCRVRSPGKVWAPVLSISEHPNVGTRARRKRRRPGCLSRARQRPRDAKVCVGCSGSCRTVGTRRSVGCGGRTGRMAVRPPRNFDFASSCAVALDDSRPEHSSPRRASSRRRRGSPQGS